MIWVWAAGIAVLAAGAVVPAVLAVHGRSQGTADQLDRARSMVSELETAIDTTPVTSSQLAQARRCLLLAGAALGADAGASVTATDCRRSIQWSRKGLRALH